jgi:tetratricopeptide (TPR) repeat protein
MGLLDADGGDLLQAGRRTPPHALITRVGALAEGQAHVPAVVIVLAVVCTVAAFVRAAPAATSGCSMAGGEAAIAACTRIIASGSARGGSLTNPYVVRCHLWNRKREYDRALADCGEALRLDPRLALGHHGRCWAWNEKKDHDRAIAECNEAIRLDPRHAGAFTLRGLAWSAKGEHARAIADHDQAVRLDPRASALYVNRAVSRLYQRDHDRAIADFDRAITLDRKNAAAFHGRGVAFRNTHDFERAVADATQALRLNPNYPDAYENRGHALTNLGRYDRAVADFTQAIRLHPRFAQAYVGRGLAFAEQRELDRAIADYDAAIRLDPGLAAAYTNRGLALERKGDRTAARADFQAALAAPAPPQHEGHAKWAHDTARDRLAAPVAPPQRIEPAPEAAPVLSAPEPSRERPREHVMVAPDPPRPGGGQASSAHRLALIIGNARYPDADPPLVQPVGDARALADELKRSGFDVVLGENLTRQRLLDAFRDFKDRIKSGSTTLLFFSGYGIQAGQQAYVLPIDAQVWTERDVVREGVSIESLIGEINDQGAVVKLVILDAARRNPYERRFRGGSSGLAPIVVPANTLVIYSTGIGQFVEERGGEQSLFARELIKELRAPGATAEDAFARTRIGVSRVSEAAQVPWVSSTLLHSFAFGPPEQRRLR